MKKKKVKIFRSSAARAMAQLIRTPTYKNRVIGNKKLYTRKRKEQERL